MCIYSPMPHTLSYCALIGKCALIRSNTVFLHQKKSLAVTTAIHSSPTFCGLMYAHNKAYENAVIVLKTTVVLLLDD